MKNNIAQKQFLDERQIYKIRTFIGTQTCRLSTIFLSLSNEPDEVLSLKVCSSPIIAEAVGIRNRRIDQEEDPGVREVEACDPQAVEGDTAHIPVQQVVADNFEEDTADGHNAESVVADEEDNLEVVLQEQVEHTFALQRDEIAEVRKRPEVEDQAEEDHPDLAEDWTAVGSHSEQDQAIAAAAVAAEEFETGAAIVAEVDEAKDAAIGAAIDEEAVVDEAVDGTDEEADEEVDAMTDEAADARLEPAVDEPDTQTELMPEGRNFLAMLVEVRCSVDRFAWKRKVYMQVDCSERKNQHSLPRSH